MTATPLQIRLKENGQPDDVALAADMAAALAASGLVTVEPRPAGVYRVTPGAQVGTLRLRRSDDEVDVEVAPKVGIARLLFLLAYARDPGWRDDPATFTRSPDLLTAVTEALGRTASHAIGAGVLQGYRTVEESSPVVRGRVLAGRQMTRRLALPLPLEVRFDEYDTDIAENRILLTACRRGLGVPRIPSDARVRLHKVLARLDGVSAIPLGSPRPVWRPTRLNARYQAALRLGELLLDHLTLERDRVTDIEAHGFVVTMWKVFEDFVTKALSEAFRRHPGTTAPQFRVDLDTGALVPMKPDLVRLLGRRPVAVVDAKYKADRGQGFPNGDVYQLLAYCTALKLTEGHLIYARGIEEQRRYDIPPGLAITAHALDLGGTPTQLLERIDELAEVIATSSLG